MKDSLSLVSDSVCHISSSDDAVIIVPVHCDLLQNTLPAAGPLTGRGRRPEEEFYLIASLHTEQLGVC